MDSGCFSTRGLRKGTTAKPLDGGVLPHRGARAPARGPAAAPWLLSLAPWLPPFCGERTQRGEMSLGFAGDASSPGFCFREKSARPLDPDRRRRTAGNGGRRMGQIWPKRGAAPGRFGGLAVSCWAEGPSAARAEWTGLISRPGRFNSARFNSFCYFFRSIYLMFFCSLLISIQI